VGAGLCNGTLQFQSGHPKPERMPLGSSSNGAIKESLKNVHLELNHMFESKKKVELDRSQRKLLLSEDGKIFLESLEQQFSERVHFSVGEHFTLTAPKLGKEHNEEVLKAVGDFLEDNAVYQERVLLSEAEIRFIQEYKQEEFSVVPLAFVSQFPQIILKGTNSQISSSKSRLKELTLKLVKEIHTIHKENAFGFLVTHEGQNCLRKIEEQTQCIIMMDGFAERVDKDNSQSTVTYSVRLLILSSSVENIRAAIGGLQQITFNKDEVVSQNQTQQPGATELR